MFFWFNNSVSLLIITNLFQLYTKKVHLAPTEIVMEKHTTEYMNLGEFPMKVEGVL